MTVGWRARASDGATFVTVLMTENSTKAINEAVAAPELLALAKGAFTLPRVAK